MAPIASELLTSVLGTGYQQEVHTDRLYADLAEYNLVVDNPAQLPGVVDIARLSGTRMKKEDPCPGGNPVTRCASPPIRLTWSP
jgi:hypothetical protein